MSRSETPEKSMNIAQTEHIKDHREAAAVELREVACEVSLVNLTGFRTS